MQIKTTLSKAFIALSAISTFYPNAFANNIDSNTILKQTKTNKNWTMRVGLANRKVKNINTQTAGYASDANFQKFTESRSSNTSIVGKENQIDNRLYNDGFVLIDIATADDLQTWAWGYLSESQINSDGDLVFTANVGQRTTVERHGSTSTASISQDDNANGIEIGGYKIYQQQNGFGIGLDLSAAYFGFHQKNQFQTYSNTQIIRKYQTQITDTFRPISPLPEPPFSKTDINEPGPLIENIPISRHTSTRMTSKNTFDDFNKITTQLNGDVITLSAGGLLEKNLNKNRFQFGAGATINLIHAKGRYDETLYRSQNKNDPIKIAHMHDTKSDDIFKLGAYVKFGYNRMIGEKYFLGIEARYDWLDKFNLDVGAATNQIDFSGRSILAKLIIPL